jgi:YHS domain-containing protein
VEKLQQPLVKDPVCGTEVPPDDYAVEFRQIPYAFCSRQCQKRFLAHPHLFVGHPGHKAPRQEGKQVLKRRSLKLARPLDTAQIDVLVHALESLRGVRQLKASHDRLEIAYDLLEVTAEEIEQRLQETGVRLGDGWADRLRLAFVHYEEELESHGLEVTDRNIHG